MAVLPLTGVEIVLSDMVGRASLMRARRLVRAGKVGQVRSKAPGGVVRGVVRDGRRDFEAVAVIRRQRDGGVDINAWSCTCDDEFCPHAAALILTHEGVLNGSSALTRQPAPPKVRAPAAWELALTSALSDKAKPATSRPRTASDLAPPEGEPPVALQFELTNGPRFQLSVRLVVPGRNGTWVRGSLSWMSLAYPERDLRTVPRDQRRLLKELHALPSAHQAGWQDKFLFLDAIVSRRVWDLLREVDEAGIPLVMEGRAAAPVHVHTDPVAARLYMHRQEAGLVIEPVLESGGQRVTSTYLPMSDPPHGVAWVPGPGEGLRLAPLGEPPSELFWQLSRGPVPPIPAADEDRFLSAFYPQLAQHVEVVSADESLVLPQAQPPVLELTVTPLGNHRMRLDWAWSYRIGDTERHESLQRSPGQSSSIRDTPAETRILAGIAPLLSDLPGILQHVGDRPVPFSQSTVQGMTSARLIGTTIPQLRELTDVRVRLAVDGGQIPEYRQSDEEPVFEFTANHASAGGVQDWLDLAVSITIDGQPVPFEDVFVALARGDTELLLANGLWFTLDRPQFHQLAALIAESREMLDAPAGTVRLSRFHASTWDELEQLGVIAGELETWRASIQALSSAQELPEAKLPAGLEATLRPYQEDGFRWLATLFGHRLGGVLADDMGLGKTLQTLALFLHAREQGLSDRPFLVVAPTSVVPNWEQEAHRFVPGFTVATITSTNARRGHDVAAAVQGADLVITSYTLFRLEFDQYAEQDWAGLVLDEAQSVKNHQATGYRCARELRTDFKLAITGTPMENNLMELWALFSITSPGLFPRPERFTEHYRTPIEREQDAGKLGQLRRRVAPLMLRRTKDLVAADLPARQEQTVELELLPRHRKVYQKYLQRERQKVLGLLGDLNRNRFEIFRSLTLLRQAALDVSLIDPAHEAVPSTKIDALLEQLPEIAAEGHRVLVFSQFTRFLNRTAARLDEAGLEYSYLDGKTRNRARVIDGFRKGSAPVFLISLKAGGAGLNLTEADYVYLLDPWWNPAVEAQAVDRAHRIGQTRNVMVYRMVARNTIEEKVMALKARKSALTESVLAGEEMGSSALTAEDIRHLLD
ncbi:DNA helicase [Kineosporia sp. NBRC 101677]|uniref:DEAD/DEAH box helicase n=1 Tax=Kineosporia sp. NBRC 101677 TaxID=3032197 RepID=UPI0024A3CFD6|nr:DEAD/DEAH box helicase [Kineosporia sp. NBRC 101677]GLY20125.1 DNA helicase [Kineosporia sp. NBRC 101677]